MGNFKRKKTIAACTAKTAIIHNVKVRRNVMTPLSPPGQSLSIVNSREFQGCELICIKWCQETRRTYNAYASIFNVDDQLTGINS